MLEIKVNKSQTFFPDLLHQGIQAKVSPEPAHEAHKQKSRAYVSDGGIVIVQLTTCIPPHLHVKCWCKLKMNIWSSGKEADYRGFARLADAMSVWWPSL